MDVYKFVTKDVFENIASGETHECGVDKCTARKRKNGKWICSLTGVTLGNAEVDNIGALSTKRQTKRVKVVVETDIRQICDAVLMKLFIEETTRIRLPPDVDITKEEMHTYSDKIAKVHEWLGYPRDCTTPLLIACLLAFSEGLTTDNLLINRDPKMSLCFTTVKELASKCQIKQRDVMKMYKLLIDHPLGYLDI